MRRRCSTRNIVRDIQQKVENLVTTVAEVQGSIEALKADLEGLAATAQAEFAKLESEIAAGQPANLAPLKEAIDGIDAKVKTAVIPTA